MISVKLVCWDTHWIEYRKNLNIVCQNSGPIYLKPNPVYNYDLIQNVKKVYEVLVKMVHCIPEQED